MMRLTLDVEKDCVVLKFDRPGRWLGLTLEQAKQVADEIRRQSIMAEGWVKTGGSRRPIDDRNARIGVQGRDGKVYLIFDKNTTHEYIPWEAALHLVHEMMTALQQMAWSASSNGPKRL